MSDNQANSSRPNTARPVTARNNAVNRNLSQNPIDSSEPVSSSKVREPQGVSSGLNGDVKRSVPSINVPPKEEPKKNLPVSTPMLMQELESELHLESSKEKRKKLLLKIGIGVVSVALIAIIIYFAASFGSKKEVPLVDGNQVGATSAMNSIPSINGGKSSMTTTTFNGEPVPVQWPSDVKPTRMEVFLSPVNGEPVLMLVGDKDGLGTVIRSYNQSGALSGYWVIVPEGTTATGTAANATTNTTQQPTIQQQAPTQQEVVNQNTPTTNP